MVPPRHVSAAKFLCFANFDSFNSQRLRNEAGRELMNEAGKYTIGSSENEAANPQASVKSNLIELISTHETAIGEPWGIGFECGCRVGKYFFDDTPRNGAIVRREEPGIPSDCLRANLPAWRDQTRN